MRMTEQDKARLIRFGCTLQVSQNLLCIKWTDLNREQALRASILVRTIFSKCPSGPLLCLALEISPTRALPTYCYSPFNLRNRTQQNYLSSLTQTGQLRLGFLARGGTVFREHRLLPSERREVDASCTEALQVLKACGATYKFSDVVSEFESTVRIPLFFDRAVSETELIKAFELAGAEAQKVPAEKRSLAHQVVRGIADAFRNHWGDYLTKQIGELPKARTAFLLLLDVQRVLGNDYDAFLNFVADTVAVHTEEEALRKAISWPSNLELILRLFEEVGSASQEEQQKVRSDLLDALSNVFTHLGSGRELSLSMLRTLILPLRPLLPGQPGRPAKDYSREYDWKASGLSWTKVTRKSLIENPDIRKEFEGCKFDSLTFEERENLTNRIREGVKSYAERTGRPFPIEKAEPHANPADPQKNN